MTVFNFQRIFEELKLGILAVVSNGIPHWKEMEHFSKGSNSDNICDGVFFLYRYTSQTT